jgi:hypothetical protein
MLMKSAGAPGPFQPTDSLAPAAISAGTCKLASAANPGVTERQAITATKQPAHALVMSLSRVAAIMIQRTANDATH